MSWCKEFSLELNVSKSKDIIIHFRNQHPSPNWGNWNWFSGALKNIWVPCVIPGCAFRLMPMQFLRRFNNVLIHIIPLLRAPKWRRLYISIYFIHTFIECLLSFVMWCGFSLANNRRDCLWGWPAKWLGCIKHRLIPYKVCFCIYPPPEAEGVWGSIGRTQRSKKFKDFSLHGNLKA